ncbi:MAG: NUDIX hydrolase [Chloroflexi bacterium]|uniref:NUDIX hydrolase n=1 Tax=Candidatus Flexifilum breve TaxID=3140694 RepID=UPI003134A7EB|nr:NUDIX hydrolase [Chloroflexota bacterium]
MSIPQWLDWAQRLQSIAQTGLHYDAQPFDRLRYEDVMQIAAEMLAAGSDTALDEIKPLLQIDKGHTTPKIDVRGVVFQDDKILLVQEKLDNYRWTLPGGWADIGESAGVSVAREIYEETGYHARAVKLLALYDRNQHAHPPYQYHAYKAFFRCELLSDLREPDPRNVETGEVGFFGEDELPELSTARVTADQISRFFAHLRQPELPTDFD